MRTTARRDGDEYVLDGSKRFITNAGVAKLYTVFAKTDPDAGHSRDLGVRRRGRHARVRGARGSSRSSGISRLDDRRARLRRLPRPRRRTCSARRARASRSRCGSSTARARASPRRRSGSRRARPTTRSSTRRRARRWASRSPQHQLIQAKLADMETRVRGRARAALPLRPDGRRGRRRARADEGLRAGEAVLRRRRDGRHDRGGPDPRRLRLHQGVPGRAHACATRRSRRSTKARTRSSGS